MIDNKTSNIEIFFASLFPKIILKNEIIATIVYNISLRLTSIKKKIDNTTNTDI